MRSFDRISLAGLLLPSFCTSFALPDFALSRRQGGESLKFKSYTAVGDSYASGVGAGYPAEQNAGHPNCRRNKGSYAYLFNQRHPVEDFEFNACSGQNSDSTTAAQINADNSEFRTPELVTLQAGGNDGAAFYKIATDCIYDLEFNGDKCDAAIKNAHNTFKPIQG